jgi:hypothetical protein
LLASLDTPSPASASWTDIGKQALLDALHGITTGSAASQAAGQVGIGLPDPTALAAAAAASAAARTRTVLIVAGVAAAVVIGALLLRRK